jgi:hypothetical protein
MRENRTSGSMRGCRKRATSRRACALLYAKRPGCASQRPVLSRGFEPAAMNASACRSPAKVGRGCFTIAIDCRSDIAARRSGLAMNASACRSPAKVRRGCFTIAIDCRSDIAARRSGSAMNASACRSPAKVRRGCFTIAIDCRSDIATIAIDCRSDIAARRSGSTRMVICFMFSSGAGFEPASSCRVSRRQHNERVETQRPRQVSTLIIEKMPGTVYAPDPDPRFERARLGRRQQRLPRHRTLPAMDEKALSVAVPVAQFELTWLGRPQAAPVGNGENCPVPS